MAFNLNLQSPLALLGVVIGAIITITFLAATMGDYLGSVQAVNENLTTANTGSAVADSIAKLMPMVIGVAAVVGPIGVILYAVAFKHKRGD